MQRKKIGAIVAVSIIVPSLVLFASIDLDLTQVSLFNPTPGFGKTHFIVGYPQEDYKTLLGTQPHAPVQSSHDVQVFFSPDDNLQEEFNALVRQEQECIRVAVYVFTNKDIANALIDAKKRGVDVQIVTDPGHMKDRHSKVGALLAAGIPVFEYNPNYIKDGRSNIMHHKFAIFGKPEVAGTRLWTGSFNFTKSATTRNQENAVIMQGGVAVKRFADQYELLKKRCVRCYHSADKNTTFAKNHGGAKYKRIYA